jgi:hypothetical protein
MERGSSTGPRTQRMISRYCLARERIICSVGNGRYLQEEGKSRRKETIGTRKEIHILHRKDKLIPPVRDE